MQLSELAPKPRPPAGSTQAASPCPAITSQWLPGGFRSRGESGSGELGLPLRSPWSSVRLFLEQERQSQTWEDPSSFSEEQSISSFPGQWACETLDFVTGVLSRFPSLCTRLLWDRRPVRFPCIFMRSLDSLHVSAWFMNFLLSGRLVIKVNAYLIKKKKKATYSLILVHL